MQVTGILSRAPDIVKVGKSPFASENVTLVLVTDRPTETVDLIDFYRLKVSGEYVQAAKRYKRGDVLHVQCDLTSDNGATKCANVVKIKKEGE